MREHNINSLDNFICGWYLNDTSICDKVIQYHKNSNKKQKGLIAGVVDKDKKDSIDVALLDKSLYQEYCYNNLLPVTELYKKKYEFCNDVSQWGIVENINVQHYTPGGGFKVWHTERMSSSFPSCNRHLVFMTFLNDVTDGGETEFYHQKLMIKPEKGLTLIWGSDWTFSHRGVVSPSQDKYIITGWFGFL